MNSKRIGFIGFGEVARAFSREMNAHGAVLHYYDIVEKEHPEYITFLPLSELAVKCDIVLSTVTTNVAVAAAQNSAPFLRPETVYADMNSTSPSVKMRIAEIIGKKAIFVEGSILSAVGESGAKSVILVSGEQAASFASRMNELGLVNLKYFSPRIGEASQVKMLRSIFSKGVECLLLEMLLAARKAGLAEYLWNDIVELMTKHSFKAVAENWIRTHPLACERRYHEMGQVLETLSDLDIEPVMTQGTANFFKRSMDLCMGQGFTHKPANFWDVPARLEEVLEMLKEKREHSP
jgi:3-hydroxyisobutyrate dehydrogenase-like beta-hydroxyacid dehydrogenase